MKNVFYCILFFMSCTLLSCTTKTKERTSDSYELVPKETYLSFPIDEDTRLPKFCLWSFTDNQNEYIAFNNRGDEILFYDVKTQRLVKKVKYEREGPNGVIEINSFYVKDFNHIYIPSPKGGIFVTDTTARIKQKIDFSQLKGESLLVSFLSATINHSPICFVNDKLYIHQPINPKLGGDFLPNSPVGALIDTVSGTKEATPLTYLPYVPSADIPSYLRGTIVSHCYDGEKFVYSYDTEDSLVMLSADFSKRQSYTAKSRYIDKVKVVYLKDVDMNIALKRNCEIAGYGNIVYDKYRQVYYRFAHPDEELDDEDAYYMDILHWGRKQFSIIILDKDLNVIGETLFPAYTYNSMLYFVAEDGLYLSATHFKRPDFDENVLRFQKMELEKTSQKK